MKPSHIDLTDWPTDALWKRKRTEKDPAWLAFFTYLGMHPGERSVLAAYRIYSGDTTAKAAPRQWNAWATFNHWQERITEYERWRAGKERIRAEAAQNEEHERWEKIRTAERDRGLKIGQALLEKAQAMLAFPLAEVERVTSVYPDGSPKEVQIFKPANWNFGTVARMIEVGSKLVNLMSQMPTERHQIDLSMIYDEADKVAKDLGVSREDVLSMADKIVKEHQERLEEEGRV